MYKEESLEFEVLQIQQIQDKFGRGQMGVLPPPYIGAGSHLLRPREADKKNKLWMQKAFFTASLAVFRASPTSAYRL